MKLRELLEARKNPDQNPKLSINDEIIDRYKDTMDEIGGTKNLFVSFTQINKLGINPRSKYNTPLGIYAYPAEFIVNEIGPSEEMHNLPFAGEHPYANMFSARGNVVNIEDLSNLDGQCERLIRAFPQHEEQIRQFKIDSISNTKEEFRQHDFGQFWYVTRALAQEIKGEGSHARKWNMIFRRLGIDGIVDINNGVIHENEPIQAVFFSARAIIRNEVVINKYSKTAMRIGKSTGDLNKNYAEYHKIKSWTPEQFLHYYNTQHSAPSLFRLANYKTRLEVIKYKPELASFLPKPTPEEQLAALKYSNNEGQSFQLRMWNNIMKPETLAKAMNLNLASSIVSDPVDFQKFINHPAVVDSIFKQSPDFFFKLKNPTKLHLFSALKNGVHRARAIEYYKIKDSTI
jgi:hypothetical protein